MLVSGIPYKFVTPWAADAAAGYITGVIPSTASGPAASQALGFPPVTATNVSAGGVPPNIADFNGFGLYVTEWLQWVQAGGPILWDATFSGNVGGYPKGAIVQAAVQRGAYWISTVDNNTSNPDAGGANWSGAVTSIGQDAGGANVRMVDPGGNYGAFWRNDGASLILMFTPHGTVFSGWNSLRPFTVTLSTGAVLIDGTGAGAQFGGAVTVLGSGTISGNLTAQGFIVSNNLLAVNGAAGTGRHLYFQTSTFARWSWYASETPETGGNAGSDLILQRFDDSGTLIGSVVKIARSNGSAEFFDAVQVDGVLGAHGITNVGDISNSSGAIFANCATGLGTAAQWVNTTNTAGGLITFQYSATPVGGVTTNGTTTSYNTTSDATLKIDDGPITNSGQIIDRLRPKLFRWKSDPDAQSEPGFFAQQVHRVFPWAVRKGHGRRGRKNFQPWMMDAAKLMPIVVAELQSARQRIAHLEKALSRIEAR